MTLDQLLLVVQEAALNLTERAARPYPVTVVVPLPGSTRVMSLEGFPDGDDERTDVLSVFAATHLVPDNAACFGVLAEATGSDGQDLLVAVYGARRRGSFVTAAIISADALGQSGRGEGALGEGALGEFALGEFALGEFAEPEPLEPTAMPFIQPLQHAVDMAEPPSDTSQGGLPIIGS